MRGSSMERQDRRRRRDRLNGAFRENVEGEAGSAGWEARLSVEPLWPRLLCSQEDKAGT